MRSIVLKLVGPAMYLASVFAAMYTVETLNSRASANSYLEWTAIVLIISALTDLGMPSSLQWALLSRQTISDTKLENFDRKSIYLLWIKWSLKGLKNPYIFLVLFISAISIILKYIFDGVDPIKLYSLYWVSAIIAIISVNVRKVSCSFLDGAGLFATSRLILALPNLLIALILGILVVVSDSLPGFLDIALIAAMSYFTAGMFGIILLCMPRVHSRIPSVSIEDKKNNSSLRWYFLSITSAIQSQIFYVLAPRAGISEYMVPIFYTQKVVQVSSEFIAQIVKEWTYSRKNLNYSWKVESKNFTLYLALFPALLGGIAFGYSNHKFDLEILMLITFIVLEAGLSTLYTCRGHIALMNESSAPVINFIIGATFQSVLSIILVPIIGAVGYYASVLVSGILFSYRANQKIYSEIIK